MLSSLVSSRQVCVASDYNLRRTTNVLSWKVERVAMWLLLQKIFFRTEYAGMWFTGSIQLQQPLKKWNPAGEQVEIFNEGFLPPSSQCWCTWTFQVDPALDSYNLFITPWRIASDFFFMLELQQVELGWCCLCSLEDNCVVFTFKCWNRCLDLSSQL